MKKEYACEPKIMESMETYGFSWMDFVTAIPSPLFVVTSYKLNGLPNACLQSWATFVGDEENFYCIMASVNKQGHMYQSIQETGDLVLNFPSADIYEQCSQTIKNNGFDDDEIAKSGLTPEKASVVNAPMLKECFLNMECQYHWEKELIHGGSHVVMCVKVKNIHMDTYLFEEESGRYGDKGYIYNVHHPINPETGTGNRDSLAVLKKITDTYTY